MVIEEGLSSRISENTGNLGQGGSSLISNAGRKRIWEELCGAWKDEREYGEIRTKAYGFRTGNESRESYPDKAVTKEGGIINDSL